MKPSRRTGQGWAAGVVTTVALALACPSSAVAAPADHGPAPASTVLTQTLDSGRGTDDGFGFAVDIDGDTLVVGTPAWINGGAAYVFVRDGTEWVEQTVLQAPDGQVGDTFGYSVAVDGDTVAVGSIYHRLAGAAYVFRRSGTRWSFEAKLRPAVADGQDQFGADVDLDGDVLAVGADGDETAVGVYAGSAHVYVRRGTDWRLQDSLIPADAAAGDGFGTAVSVSGSTVLAGAPGADPSGAVFVFDRTGGAWNQVAEVRPPEPTADFGRAFTLDSGTLLVGAPRDDFGIGSAYVFERSSPGFVHRATLRAPDGQLEDQFGDVVALSGPVAVVGASFDDVGDRQIAGSAYVFRRDGTAWSLRAHLVPGPTAPLRYGGALAIEGRALFVGAPALQGTGAAYVYTVVPG